MEPINKKILVISGSPRKKGNTLNIVKIIKNRMMEIDYSIEFNYLYLKDKDLKWCIGCLNCLRWGGDFCPHKDDAREIKDKLYEADGLIFASPCYTHQVSAMFKNFMDRFMYLDHLPEFIGVPALIVSTAETDGPTAVTKYINNMFAIWWGCYTVAKVGIPYTAFNLNKKYQEKVLKRLNAISNNFCKALNDKTSKRPSLLQYLSFLWNKNETLLYWNVFPGRYKFWKQRGWIESNYYYDTKISILHRLVGMVSFGFLKIYARMMLGKKYQKRLNEQTGDIGSIH